MKEACPTAGCAALGALEGLLGDGRRYPIELNVLGTGQQQGSRRGPAPRWGGRMGPGA